MARASQSLTLPSETEPSCRWPERPGADLDGPMDRLAELDRLACAGRVALGAAHDLNNLIIVLGLGLQQVERSLPAGPERERTRELAQIVERASLAVRALRSAAPGAAAPVERIDLGELLRGAEPTLALLAGAHVHLCVHHPRPLHVEAARGALEQVLMNLVSNASDAAAETGGRRVVVTVAALATEWQGGATAAGGPLAPGRYAALEVSDDGPGVPPECRARLFEPFYSSKPVGRGTGLGLTLVAETARAAGGGVVVESSPGAGATFRVLLPLVP